MHSSATTSTRCPTCFAELTSARSCSSCARQGRSRPSPLALPSGSLLDRQYRTGQVLGQPGGFGITYLAWDEKLETRVAIKEFFPRDLAGRGTDRATVQPHTETDESTFEYGLGQFLNEARTLARFDHPNIVRVRNFFEANGTGYLVMDYYEGESLFAYLAREPDERLREDLAVRILLPVLDGLRAVHAQGMLHRDIDPHNIYLTTQGRVILLDFGAARMAVGDRSRSLSVILKPGYAPYEQYASSGKQGPWTDVYACAATLFRMVTGRVPVDAPSRILDDTLAPAREVNPEVSQPLSDVLQRGMALRADERPQTAEEFQRLLLGGRATGEAGERGGEPGEQGLVKAAGGEGIDPGDIEHVDAGPSTGRDAWLIAGLVSYVLAWFMQVVKTGVTLADGGLPGWQAFYFAASFVILDNNPEPLAILYFLSSQTNFVLVTAAILLVRREIDRIAEHAVPVWVPAALWVCASVNLVWLVLFRTELRAGYFLWIAGFALVALAATRSRRAERARGDIEHDDHWTAVPRFAIPVFIASGIGITVVLLKLLSSPW